MNAAVDLEMHNDRDVYCPVGVGEVKFGSLRRLHNSREVVSEVRSFRSRLKLRLRKKS